MHIICTGYSEGHLYSWSWLMNRNQIWYNYIALYINIKTIVVQRHAIDRTKENQIFLSPSTAAWRTWTLRQINGKRLVDWKWLSAMQNSVCLPFEIDISANRWWPTTVNILRPILTTTKRYTHFIKACGCWYVSFESFDIINCERDQHIYLKYKTI